jgi:hypothetical protein
MKITKELAECVGLWLAEGDNKTEREITFTNNCLELILFFHANMDQLYCGKNKPRLYVYSSTPRILITNLNGLIIRNYSDSRARKTYYIYRLANVQFVKEWKLTVNEVKLSPDYYPEVLRGLFAGEGNVKHDLKNNNSRHLRIASGVRNEFIEKLLCFFDIPLKFDSKKRVYWIHGRSLEKLNSIDIASLHPEKEAKFRRMINSVKEKHYSPHEFRTLILKELNSFKTTKQLAKFFKKSEIYTLEVLSTLKKERTISNVKTKNGSFWAKKHIIEHHHEVEEFEILHNLNKHGSLSRTESVIGMARKVIASRLLRYQKEGLVSYIPSKRSWKLTEKGKIIVGVDESGSEF